MRKLLIASSLLAVPVAALAVSVRFSDVPDGAWYEDYVYDAAEDGIVSGYTDSQGRLTGEFGPGNTVTLAEALKIAVEGAGYDIDSYASYHGETSFGHWIAPYYRVALQEKFGTYVGADENVDLPARRQEVARVITDAFFPGKRDEILSFKTDHPFTDLKQAGWPGPILKLYAEGVISGDADASGELTGTVRPLALINRAETVKLVMLARAKFGTPGKSRPVAKSSPSQANTVHYTEQGFSPSTITIKKGTELTILNDTNGSIDVNSDPHPFHTSYPQMNSPSPTPAKGFYKFQFNVEGTYQYHNHFNPSHKGTVIVEE